MTSIGPPDGNARRITTVQIDPGYPVATILLSPADLLAISFNPATGLLSTNTSDIYFPPPISYTTDASGWAIMLHSCCCSATPAPASARWLLTRGSSSKLSG